MYEEILFMYIFCSLATDDPIASIRIQEFARKVKSYDGGDAVK